MKKCMVFLAFLVLAFTFGTHAYSEDYSLSITADAVLLPGSGGFEYKGGEWVPQHTKAQIDGPVTVTILLDGESRYLNFRINGSKKLNGHVVYTCDNGMAVYLTADKIYPVPNRKLKSKEEELRRALENYRKDKTSDSAAWALWAAWSMH